MLLLFLVFGITTMILNAQTENQNYSPPLPKDMVNEILLIVCKDFETNFDNFKTLLRCKQINKQWKECVLAMQKKIWWDQNKKIRRNALTFGYRYRGFTDVNHGGMSQHNFHRHYLLYALRHNYYVWINTYFKKHPQEINEQSMFRARLNTSIKKTALGAVECAIAHEGKRWLENTHEMLTNMTLKKRKLIT